VIGDATLPLRTRNTVPSPVRDPRTYRPDLQGEPPEDFNLLPGMAMPCQPATLPVSPAQQQVSAFACRCLRCNQEGISSFIWAGGDARSAAQDLVLESVEDGQGPGQRGRA